MLLYRRYLSRNDLADAPYAELSGQAVFGMLDKTWYLYDNKMLGSKYLLPPTSWI